MSRFGAIESSCLAQLQTISGFSDVRAVASAQLMNGRPSSYPAAWLAITNGTKRISTNNPAAGHTQYAFDVEVGICIFANSDGAVDGDARFSAWSLVDSVMDAMTNFAPAGLTNTNAGPCLVGDPVTVITDAGLTAIYLPLTIRLDWIL